MVDGQLVGNAVEGDTEQAVIIQTADQIFQYLLLATRQFALTHLLHEFVHERDRVAIDHTLIVGRIGRLRTGIIDRQVIVLASYSLQGRVEGVLSFLPLLLLFEGFSSVGRGRRVVFLVLATHLKGRIVIDFSADVFLQFRQRHLQQAHLQHLLLREPVALHLDRRLRRSLFEFLSHDLFVRMMTGAKVQNSNGNGKISAH